MCMCVYVCVCVYIPNYHVLLKYLTGIKNPKYKKIIFFQLSWMEHNRVFMLQSSEWCYFCSSLLAILYFLAALATCGPTGLLFSCYSDFMSGNKVLFPFFFFFLQYLMFYASFSFIQLFLFQLWLLLLSISSLPVHLLLAISMLPW